MPSLYAELAPPSAQIIAEYPIDIKNITSLFLGALPFVSVGNHFFAVNATYIPQVTPKTSALVYFQLMFKLAEF
jgi:hypothetical protein